MDEANEEPFACDVCERYERDIADNADALLVSYQQGRADGKKDKEVIDGHRYRAS